MFIIILDYVKPLTEVDALLTEHVDFLNHNYAAGIFLVSGRKIPRTGGVIIAKAESLEDLMAVIKTDPFYQAGVAKYTVTEFTASMTAEELSFLKDRIE